MHGSATYVALPGKTALCIPSPGSSNRGQHQEGRTGRHQTISLGEILMEETRAHGNNRRRIVAEAKGKTRDAMDLPSRPLRHRHHRQLAPMANSHPG